MTTVSREKILAKRKRLRCVDCGDTGLIVVDHSEGNQICINCGRVAESVLISDEQEWRSFNSESTGGSKNDRSRVGDLNDVWLENANSTTFIGGSRKMQQIQNLIVNSDSADRYLKSAFTVLRQITDTINLNDLVIERGKEILKELNDANQLKGRSNMLNMLAVVYMACREVGVSRTLKELVICDSKITEKELGRAINRMKKLLPKRGDATVEDTSQLLPRFCSKLNVPNKMASLCEYAAGKAALILRTSHRTTSLAAGTIYFITQVAWLPNIETKPPTASEIATVCGVSENTLKSVYKELVNVTHRILPANAIVEKQAA
ncbi:Transcription initiation factor IIB [Babesia sp. Xinjiang]|uniref:Transcription initiation factor IIB n=1 Tax=Babesia sp. Xinjiang TaxID=462227 RepID=UPI000A224316|nr:Transcription initiation factor IIB [Babesia sp. Xinjiang]XP_028871443.1 Transcription initiation factor IIB [Babesia sp. Xinjiang]ORM40883.1 Transcription initiation factor IIB [Babesia sp. Xinjiang]ORM40987.1 Transcription initiation factor IIB [Babesia sp. Xinjiang]